MNNMASLPADAAARSAAESAAADAAGAAGSLAGAASGFLGPISDRYKNNSLKVFMYINCMK